MKNIRLLVAAFGAAFFIAGSAFAQNPGAVTNHAFPVGKGPGVQGFGSLLLGNGQIAIGQTSADPSAVTPSGDVTINSTGVTAIGANKVTNTMLRQSGALSLIGRSANSTGNVADISATPASSCVFMESSNTLTCATIAAANIAANAVTNAKLATAGAYTLKGNATGSTATPSDIDITALTAKASPVAADVVLIQDSAASFAYKKATVGGIASAGTVSDVNGLTGSVVVPIQPGGRLTLTSATPITTTDVTAATSVFYAPINSPYVPIYNGTNVRQYQFTSSATDQVGLTITLGSNWAATSNFDAFAGIDTATVRGCTGPAWTSDTARGTGAGTTELQLYNGLWTNKNSMTCRYNNTTTFTCAANQCTYLGTFRTVATGQAEDSMAKRFVWNAYNQIQRVLKNVTETTDSWSYTTATFRQANANTANQLDMVIGLAGNLLDAKVLAVASTSAGTSFAAVGIGINSTTVNSGQSMSPTPSTNRGLIQATYQGYPAIGRQFYAWLELSSPAAGTTTFDGDGANPTFSQSGISATMLM